MHELSIALAILEMAGEEAERRGAAGVEAIHLRLGELSGVVKEALLSAYQVASEKTGFEGTRLLIEEVPVEVYCPACGGRRPADPGGHMLCAECGAPAREVVSGREVEVTALELRE